MAIVEKNCCLVNIETLRFKLHFFLLTGALGCVSSCLAVFAKDRLGLSATSFGAVLLFQQFLYVLTKPLIGLICDYLNKLKAVICTLTLLHAAFYTVLLFLPPLSINRDAGKRSMLNVSKSSCEECLKNCIDFIHPVSVSVQEEDDYQKFVATNLNCTDLSQSPSNVSDEIYFYGSEEEFSYSGSSVPFERVIFPPTCDVTLELPSDTNPYSLASQSDDDLTILKKKLCNEIAIKCCNNSGLEDGRYKEFRTFEFWLFAVIFTAIYVTSNAILVLSETACCESIQNTGADFGRQRLWGAVGWGIFAPIGGALDDYTDDYLSACFVMIFLSFLMLWNVSYMELVKPHFPQNILRDIGKVMRSPQFLLFELGVAVNGIGLGIVWFYLIWFVALIGGSRLVCGLVHLMQCFTGELPFMFFSGYMLERLGYLNILSISLLAYGIRFVWYSQIENPWLVLPVEWMHGLAYGVFVTAMCSYAKVTAKPGTEATTQAVVSATFDGLGSGIGNVVAGLGFDYFGAHKTFLYNGIFFCSCAVLAFTSKYLTLKNSRGTLDLVMTAKT